MSSEDRIYEIKARIFDLIREQDIASIKIKQAEDKKKELLEELAKIEPLSGIEP